MRSLDDIQDEAIDAIDARLEAGEDRTYVDMPTGVGKTVMAARWERRQQDRRGGRCLFLAERTELLDQTREKFRDWADLDVAIERGTSYALDRVLYGGARVVAASVASLHSRRLREWPRDLFDRIIVDECHHCIPGSRYIGIIEHFDHGFRLGMSATPDLRMDGITMRHVFGSRAHRYPIADAIKNGHILPIRVQKCSTQVDISDLRSQATDYCLTDVAARILPAVQTLSNAVYQELRDLGVGRAVGFAPGVQAACALADGLARMGVASEATWDVDPNRAGKLARLDTNDISVLWCADLLSEGVDKPYLQGIINCTPTKSLIRMRQRVGRAVRRHPDQAIAWVIEPTWMDQRYDFCSVTDALADEDESLEVRRRARLAAEIRRPDDASDFDPLALLDAARTDAAREWEERDRADYAYRLSMAGVQRRELSYTTRSFDPVGANPTQAVARAALAACRREPMRKHQKDQLKALGLLLGDYHRASRQEADDLIQLWSGRKAAGLADRKTVYRIETWTGPYAPALSRDQIMALDQAAADDLLRRPLHARQGW